MQRYFFKLLYCGRDMGLIESIFQFLGLIESFDQGNLWKEAAAYACDDGK